ncbi:hypothetical protein [Kutzneria buriramensis]|uniref:Uncharacterized protein n=1 Tax=Kutzneria buriramensis TaxID=1045776 RepID=A0A3E0I6K3_9PSEU|nr:hypothetical protein [Kutzneria buriramensis]REH54241.1 hypothetical protein BCF44_102473 [Kutzneria buriramensis]
MAWKRFGLVFAAMLVAAATPALPTTSVTPVANAAPTKPVAAAKPATAAVQEAPAPVPAAVGAAVAAGPQWQVSVLPRPDGVPDDARAMLGGADGHGGYAGVVFGKGVNMTLTTWTVDGAVMHDAPDGYDTPSVYGESDDDTILLQEHSTDAAGALKIFTFDGADYNLVPIGSYGQYDDVRATVIGPRGDLAGYVSKSGDAMNPVPLYWPAPNQQPTELKGALPHSTPKAVDDDGTVLMEDLIDGPYLLKDGVVTKLALPPGASSTTPVALRHGVVVGYAEVSGSPQLAGVLWKSPDAPQLPDKATTLLAVTSFGMSVGVDGTQPAVWSGTREVAQLSLPDGYTDSEVRFIDEDGTVGGMVAVGPISEPENYHGGWPAVWRMQSQG